MLKVLYFGLALPFTFCLGIGAKTINHEINSTNFVKLSIIERDILNACSTGSIHIGMINFTQAKTLGPNTVVNAKKLLSDENYSIYWQRLIYYIGIVGKDSDFDYLFHFLENDTHSNFRNKNNKNEESFF